jgi:hypothetical protein
VVPILAGVEDEERGFLPLGRSAVKTQKFAEDLPLIGREIHFRRKFNQ